MKIIHGFEAFDLDVFPRGELSEGWIDARLGFGSPLLLPLLVVRGTAPGPTALVVAGVHGDEFEGVVAIPRALHRIDPSTVRGAVVGLPVANPWAHTAQSRQSPPAVDARNLARSFPGSADGSPTERLAHGLFQLVRRLLGGDDLFVDLHSAGTKYRYASLVGFRTIDGPARLASEEFARRFAPSSEALLWAIPGSRGMFNSETAAAGIPTVAAEAPGQGGCREEDVEVYARGIANLLRARGVVPGDDPQRSAEAALEPTEVYAEADGILVAHAELGDTLAASARIGTIVDPHGGVRAEVRAPHAGRLVVMRTFGTVAAGEYVAWVAA